MGLLTSGHPPSRDDVCLWMLPYRLHSSYAFRPVWTHYSRADRFADVICFCKECHWAHTKFKLNRKKLTVHSMTNPYQRQASRKTTGMRTRGDVTTSIRFDKQKYASCRGLANGLLIPWCNMVAANYCHSHGVINGLQKLRARRKWSEQYEDKWG
jgi:hypothetical protein